MIKAEEDSRSKYWQNLGVTKKSEGRVLSLESKYTNERGIYFMCNECCNKDRCDDSTHRLRENCHCCLGTGQNLTSEKLNAESNPVPPTSQP